MKILLILDPLERIQPDKDTSFALALEAQARGFEIFFCLISELTLRNANPGCRFRKVEFKRAEPCCSCVGADQEGLLDDFDYVLMRKDPPFDEEYFFATHFLSLCQKAKVLNRPEALRNAPEKIYPFQFPGIFPETLIGRDAEQIRQFMLEVGGEIILKPLNRAGGSGVLYIHEGDKNFNSLLEISTQEGKQFVIAQRYLPEIRQGDKRVILVHGKAEGAILRTPAHHEHRGNIHVGGQVTFSPLTQRDQWLIEQISPRLVQDGLYFVGIDIIGDYITEINVTSPTGIQEIQRLGGIDIAKMFWDRLGEFQG